MLDADLTTRLPPAVSLGAIADFPGAETIGAVLIVAGIVCQLMHRRLPAGLGTSLFVGATTLGVAWAVFYHRWPAAGNVYLAAGVASGLGAVWAVFGRIAARQPTQETVEPAIRSSATFFAWSLVSAVAAVALVLYLLIFATWVRLLDPDALSQTLSPAGLGVFAALIVAVCAWRSASARAEQPTIVLALAAALIWWSGLTLPAGLGVHAASTAAIARFQPRWWSWPLHVQAGLSILSVAAIVWQDVRHRARRRRAWPDALDALLTPYARWPGYIQVEAVIAAAILLLGVYQLVRPDSAVWQPMLVNCIACAATGAACLFATYRRWSGNTTGLGIALVTLAAVVLACLFATRLAGLTASTEYVQRIPILDGAMLCGLLVMVPLWSWLAGVWDQQLLDGQPWTTTGRMIPHTRRAAFLLSALAALIAFRMALWPRLVAATVEDVSMARWGVSAATILGMAVIVALRARRRESIADATLSVAFLVAMLLFAFVHAPARARQAWGWIIQYETVVLSAASVAVILVAEGLHSTRWRSFSMPLWVLALLVLPIRVLVELLPSRRLPAEWIRPMSLAILGAMYSFAGRREHRRAILVLGLVLLVAALSTLFRSYGKVIIEAVR